MRSGIIIIADLALNEIHCARYHSKIERDVLMIKWKALYNIRLEVWYIHIIPCIPKYFYNRKKKNSMTILDPDEVIYKQNKEDMYTKVTEEQKTFIQSHMSKMTPGEMSKEIDVDQHAIYYWVQKFKAKPFKHVPEPVEEKVPILRPPTQYSNRRIYDSILNP